MKIASYGTIAIAFLFATADAGRSATVPPPANLQINRLIPPCQVDSNGLTELRGVVRVPHRFTHIASIVRIFPKDVAEQYVDTIESELAGHSQAITQEQANDPNFLANRLRYARALPAMLSQSKFAIVAEDGSFRCTGFRPGSYILLAMMTTEDPSTSIPILAQDYLRSELDVPEPNKHRVYFIPGFRFLGRAKWP